jgi:hypothetical protein
MEGVGVTFRVIPGTIAFGSPGPVPAGRGLSGEASVSPSGTGTRTGPDLTSMNGGGFVTSVLAFAAGFSWCTELEAQATVSARDPTSVATQIDLIRSAPEILWSVNMPAVSNHFAASDAMLLFATMTPTGEQIGCQHAI